MTNPTPIALVAPTLVSAALALLNTQLQANLSWLTTAYGQGRRLSATDGGKTITYPAIYTGGLGGNDYINLLPDEHLSTNGGFSWWDVSNPVRHDKVNAMNSVSFDAGLVVWFQFPVVYPSPADWKLYDVWNVAKSVLDVLVQSTGKATVGDSMQIQDRVEKIYGSDRLYMSLTHDDNTRHFSQMPYGVFRIDCTVDYSDNVC